MYTAGYLQSLRIQAELALFVLRGLPVPLSVVGLAVNVKIIHIHAHSLHLLQPFSRGLGYLLLSQFNLRPE